MEQRLSSWETIASDLPKEIRFEAFASALKEDGKKTGQWWTGTLLRHSENTVRSCISSNQQLRGVDIDVFYVADESLLTLFEKAPVIEENPRAYFRVIAQNKLHEYRRKAGAMIYAGRLPDGLQVAEPYSADSDHDPRAYLSKLFKAVLSKNEQAVMELRYRGLSHPEIAVELGISHDSARQLSCRAMKKLVANREQAESILAPLFQYRGVSHP